MPRTMACTNLNCRATLNVEGREAGTKVKCPKCGAVNEVQMDLGAGFDISTITEPQEGQRIAHPARQTCPNCGALLGVRASICPQCGMDVRTGAAVELKVEKKGKMPLMLGIVGVVVLVVIIAVLVLLLLNGGNGAEAA